MNKVLQVCCLSLSLLLAQPGQAGTAPASQPYVMAQTYPISSGILKEERVINVMLPEGYAEHPELSYPVIYLLDGGQHEDFTHMAGAVQYASFSWVQRLPPSILVGIANTDRKRDMTFKASASFVWPKWMHAYSDAYKFAGGSANFMAYIENEVMPFVQTHFRTNQEKTLLGQSLAGLFASEVLLKKPQLFTNYIIMSPSFWWDNQSLLKTAPDYLKNLPASVRQVYLAVGNEGPEMVADAKAFAKAIKQAQPKTLRFVFEYLPKEDHGSILHPASLNAFQYFHPKLKSKP